jgi:hypothetical protein
MDKKVLGIVVESPPKTAKDPPLLPSGKEKREWIYAIANQIGEEFHHGLINS